MNSVVNLKDGFITFNSNIDHSLSFSKCAIGYSNYNINSHERGSLVFLTNNNANDTNISMNDIRMCIASDGNVGIGTNNPGYKLDIQGGAAQTLRILDTRAAGDAIVALKETNDNNGFDMAYIGATDDRFYIRGYNNSSTPRVDLAIDRMTSNVGIGMTNPKYKLDVAGTINASNILINGATVTANSLQWITSSSNVYTSNLSGNVGIGTTNPGYKLDIQGGAAQTLRILDTRAAGDAIVALKETNDNNGFDMAYIGATDDRFYIRGYNNSSTPRVDFAIDRATGNVGIGTSSPLKKMHILQTHNSGGTIDTTSLDITEADLIVSSMSSHTTKKDAGIMFFANGSASINISYASGFIKSGWATAGSVDWNKSYLDFNTHSANNTTWTTDMRIQGGNVGIGITNPTSKLHIINSSTASNPDAGSVGLYIFNPTNAVNQKSIITNRIAGSTCDKVMYSMDVGGSHGWSIFTRGNNTALRINNNWAGDGTDTLVIENNGNFGVGVSPSYRTHLKCNYTDISKGLHLDASDAVPSAPNQYALTIYPYVVGGGQVGWKFRTQSQTGGDKTPLTFDHEGNAYHPELLQIGSINGGTFNNIIRLRVYASDSSGTAAIFKHPNDTQGIGIRYNEIFQTNANANINLTTSGTGVIVFNTNGAERIKIAANGDVGIGKNPGYKLDVSGNINCAGIFVNGTQFSGGVSSQWTTSGTKIYYNAGNVGIGKTDPTELLDIFGNFKAGGSVVSGGDVISGNYIVTTASNSKIGIGAYPTASSAALEIVKTSGSGVSIDMLNMRFDNNWGLRFQQAYTGAGNIQYNLIHRYNTTDYNALTFKGANIGINNTNPGHKLDVNGNMFVENNIFFGTTYNGGGANFPCNKLNIWGTGREYGFGISSYTLDYFSAGHHKFYSGSGGTNWGSLKLAINGSTYSEFYGTSSTGSANYIYHGNGVASLQSAYTYFGDLVVKFNGSTWTTSWIGASSSGKIKKDIQDLDDNECLNKLLALRPVKYRYIDITKNFDAEKKVYGFIAEEVKEVLPEAVNDKEKELIPNIYIMGSVENDILTIEKELEIDVEYTCYFQTETIKIKVIQDLGNNNYKIDKTYEIKTDLFVYGKIDDNFHILKKEYFHALTVSSVQELHKIIVEQRNKINDLESRLLALEAIVMKII